MSRHRIASDSEREESSFDGDATPRVPVRSAGLVDLAALPSSSSDAARDDESSREEPAPHVFDVRRVKIEKLRTPKTQASDPAARSPPTLRIKARIYRSVSRIGKNSDGGVAKRKLVFGGVHKSPTLRVPSRQRVTREEFDEALVEVRAATESVERQVAVIKVRAHALQRETSAMVAHTEKMRATNARLAHLKHR